MKYLIQTECITRSNTLDRIFKKHAQEIEAPSLHDAMSQAIKEAANEILTVEEKPVTVIFEASGFDGNEYFLQGHVKYEPFRWAKRYEGFPMFDEEGENPYSIELKRVKPNQAESELLDILANAFPEYAFEYMNDGIHCKIGLDWINVLLHIRKLPKQETKRKTTQIGGSGDKELNERHHDYQCMRELVELVKDPFFKSFGIDICIKQIPSFSEFAQL